MNSAVETERAATVKWLHSFADYLRSSGFYQMANGIDGATVGIERGEHLALEGTMIGVSPLQTASGCAHRLEDATEHH